MVSLGICVSLGCMCTVHKHWIFNYSLASFPGDSQILSHSRFSPWLRDKIWEWPGDEANLINKFGDHDGVIVGLFTVSRG